MSAQHRKSAAVAEQALLHWFEHTAYVRTRDPERRRQEGQAYKKGDEVRFVLYTPGEVREVQRLVLAVGLRPGKPFAKNRQTILPVYGADALDWFMSRLPSGRARKAMGFSPDGQRLVRRSRDS